MWYQKPHGTSPSFNHLDKKPPPLTTKFLPKWCKTFWGFNSAVHSRASAALQNVQNALTATQTAALRWECWRFHVTSSASTETVLKQTGERTQLYHPGFETVLTYEVTQRNYTYSLLLCKGVDVVRKGFSDQVV